MATTHPELAAEFHPTKNGDLTPENIVAGHRKNSWWKCPKGEDHEWEAPGYSRVSGRGCGVCAGTVVVQSNCMATTRPELASEFHPTKNGDKTVENVLAGYTKKLWWKCPKGKDHEWEASGLSRVRGNGCSVCAGRTVVPSNCMATTHPELAAEFHPTKNGEKTPGNVVAGHSKKSWWKCPKGKDHEWEASGLSRVSGNGCSVCAGYKVVRSNCMETTHPELAAEFHPTKNGDLTPNKVVAGTGRKLWWKCLEAEDHEWEATGDNRVAGKGCPICHVGWNIATVRVFVRSLLDSGLYKTLDAAEMWVLFQQNGLRTARNTRRAEFVKALGTGRLGETDLKDFVEGRESPIDELIFGDVDTTTFFESDNEELELGGNDIANEGSDTGDHVLPELSVAAALDALESSIWASADIEAVAFLEASAVQKMWRRAYDPDLLNEVLAEAKAPRAHEVSERPRRRFLDELTAALSVELPSEYDFAINGVGIEPVLMQKHIATLVRDRRRVGNWSGTGAGKTLSAVLASRLVAADVTVVCCPNATISGWKDTIENAFPDARVVTKTLTPNWPTGNGPRYLVVNYEAFQQSNSEADVKHLCDCFPIDMIVIDEIHYAKQRGGEASLRRRLIEGLTSTAAAKKEARNGTDLYVLGMSATPVINNLREGISMIELVTGIEHTDLSDRTNIPNAMRVYQQLTTLGSRWMPPYPGFGEHNPRIDITHRFDDVIAITDGGLTGSMLALEQLLLEEKLDAITGNIDSDGGTVIYTEFVAGMVIPLVAAVKAAGYRVGVYTGSDKTGLGPFKKGEIDVLIGSSTIGTGVDGLQHVASRLIVASAPWTAAGYEQLVGRLVRTGMDEKKQVDVVFPITYINTPDGEWSYDESNRLNRIKYKKTVADAAVDGVVPEGALRSPAEAFKDAAAWLERLAAGEHSEMIARRVINVPLSGKRVDTDRRERFYGNWSKMNSRWNQTASSKTHDRLVSDPEEWENYHTLYGQARKAWTWIPYVELGDLVARGSKNLVVADFGCGEDLLGQRLRGLGFTVHSFDHVAINATITSLDIGEGVPLDDNEIDIAIFSLSLMGANNGDYLREAARVLAFDGRLHIVEAASRLDKIDDIENRLVGLGFRPTDMERVGQPEFVHITAQRTDTDPDSNINLI